MTSKVYLFVYVAVDGIQTAQKVIKFGFYTQTHGNNDKFLRLCFFPLYFSSFFGKSIIIPMQMQKPVIFKG